MPLISPSITPSWAIHFATKGRILWPNNILLCHLEQMIPFPSDIFLKVELLSHMIVLSLSFWGPCVLFSTVTAQSSFGMSLTEGNWARCCPGSSTSTLSYDKKNVAFSYYKLLAWSSLCYVWRDEKHYKMWVLFDVPYRKELFWPHLPRKEWLEEGNAEHQRQVSSRRTGEA